MNETKMFSQRLTHAMRTAGYEARPVVLEREFNQRYWGKSVSVQAVRRWLLGESIPTQDRLQVLAEWLDVDPHWLRFGERLNGSIKQQHQRWNAKMAPEERQVIENFLALPSDKRKLVGEMIDALLKP